MIDVLSHIVRGYRDRIQRGGGSVVVSSAGAITLTPLAGQDVSVLGTADFRIRNAGNSGNVFNVSRSTDVVTVGGTLTVSGTGTHTFSGPVKVSGAGTTVRPAYAHDETGGFDAYPFQFSRSAAKRFRMYAPAASNDLILEALTGAAGAEVAVESARILNASGYLTALSRFGVGLAAGTAPSHPLHVVGNSYLVGPVGINSAPGTTYQLAIESGAATRPAAFLGGAASATVPVCIVKLGATPGTGGHGIELRDSADVVLVRATTKGPAAGNSELQLLTVSDTATSGIRLQRQRTAGAAVVLDDTIGYIGADGGYGGSAYAGALRASIGFKAAEAWTVAAQGSYIVFNVTATGGVVTAECARFTPGGNLQMVNNRAIKGLDAAGTTAYTMSTIDASNVVHLGDVGLVTNLRGSNWGYTVDAGATVAGYITAKVNGTDRKLMVAA